MTTPTTASTRDAILKWISNFLENELLFQRSMGVVPQDAAYPFVRGKCREVATWLALAFPEQLRLVAGFAHWHTQGSLGNPGRAVRDQHWWCVSSTGEVFDPTVVQFAGGVSGVGGVRYEEVDLNNADEVREKVPVGRCLDCGADVFSNSDGGSNFCNDRCHDAFMEFTGFRKGADGRWVAS